MKRRMRAASSSSAARMTKPGILVRVDCFTVPSPSWNLGCCHKSGRILAQVAAQSQSEEEAGGEERFESGAVSGELAPDLAAIREELAGDLPADRVRGKPDGGAGALLRRLVAVEAQIVAERGGHFSRVAGIDRDATRLQSLGERHGEHPVGLLGLAVGRVVIVPPAFELQVVRFQIPRPVAGYIYDARRLRSFQDIREGLDYPEVTQHVRRELQLD